MIADAFGGGQEAPLQLPPAIRLAMPPAGFISRENIYPGARNCVSCKPIGLIICRQACFGEGGKKTSYGFDLPASP